MSSSSRFYQPARYKTNGLSCVYDHVLSFGFRSIENISVKSTSLARCRDKTKHPTKSLVTEDMCKRERPVILASAALRQCGLAN